MNLSIIIVSYKSDHLLESLIKKFSLKHEIIIVENSLQYSTKKKIEKKFKNSKVIIPAENLGYASAFNLAMKKCKNNFIITLTPDVLISRKLIHGIEKLLNRFNKFSLLAPEYKNKKIYQNYTPIMNKKKNEFKFKNYKFIKAKDIDWCFCIINKSKFKTKKILDENFFLYFETMDLCKNLYNQNKKMYIIKNLKFDHVGTSSTKKKYSREILLNRNWHFSWSKFYYFKKNYNYCYAFKKIIPNIYQSLIGIFLSLILFNLNHIKPHFYSLKGSIVSILLLRSFYRPKIN